MRHHTAILAGLIGLALAPVRVSAQVGFDPRALSPLGQQSLATPPAPATAAPTPQTPTPATAPPQGEPARRANRAPPQRATPARRAAPAKAGAARPESGRTDSGRTEPAKAEAAKAEAAKAGPGTGNAAPAMTPSNQAAARPSAKPATTPPGRPTAPVRPPDSRTVTVPKAPPLPVALPPPPVVVPARPPPPPTPVAVAPDAPGDALPIATGTRITFGPGRSDLNPATDAAIKSLMHAAPVADTTTFTVAAYAQGTPEDPSTARRLSLARALAVRSVLITEGVASVRIYVKALGPPSGAVPQSQDGPPDRVDITVAPGQPATPAKAP